MTLGVISPLTSDAITLVVKELKGLNKTRKLNPASPYLIGLYHNGIVTYSWFHLFLFKSYIFNVNLLAEFEKSYLIYTFATFILPVSEYNFIGPECWFCKHFCYFILRIYLKCILFRHELHHLYIMWSNWPWEMMKS